jgi:hypothetical protein
MAFSKLLLVPFFLVPNHFFSALCSLGRSIREQLTVYTLKLEAATFSETRHCLPANTASHLRKLQIRISQ